MMVKQWLKYRKQGGARCGRLLFSAVVFFLLGTLLFGCVQKTDAELTFFAMDTYMSLSAADCKEDVLSQIQYDIWALEKDISVTESDSSIAALNATGQAFFSKDEAALIEKALDYCKLTDGRLDITMYPVLQAWGFTTEEYRVPSREEIGALLSQTGYENVNVQDTEVTVPKGMQLDLGSVAKGYAGDLAVKRLRENGVRSALLDLGGNIMTIGRKPDGSAWRVGIRSPEGDRIAGVLQSKDEAVITSGGYERYFEDEEGRIWWHILDPETGYPAQNGLLSVTIIGESGFYCDALSTALFVMGEEDAVTFWREHRDFQMVLITEDQRMLVTEGLVPRFEADPSCGLEMEVVTP